MLDKKAAPAQQPLKGTKEGKDDLDFHDNAFFDRFVNLHILLFNDRNKCKMKGLVYDLPISSNIQELMVRCSKEMRPK